MWTRKGGDLAVAGTAGISTVITTEGNVVIGLDPASGRALWTPPLASRGRVLQLRFRDTYVNAVAVVLSPPNYD